MTPSLRASIFVPDGQPAAKNTFQKIASVYGKSPSGSRLSSSSVIGGPNR